MIILNFLHVAPLAKWSVYQQQHTEFFWRPWMLLTGMYAWLIPWGLNARHGTSVGRDSHSLRQVGQCSSSCFWGLRRNIASLLISHLTNTETSTNRLNALWAAVAEHNPWVQGLCGNVSKPPSTPPSPSPPSRHTVKGSETRLTARIL